MTFTVNKNVPVKTEIAFPFFGKKGSAYLAIFDESRGIQLYSASETITCLDVALIKDTLNYNWEPCRESEFNERFDTLMEKIVGMRELVGE